MLAFERKFENIEVATVRIVVSQPNLYTDSVVWDMDETTDEYLKYEVKMSKRRQDVLDIKFDITWS